jgi:hypothetical protein
MSNQTVESGNVRLFSNGTMRVSRNLFGNNRVLWLKPGDAMGELLLSKRSFAGAEKRTVMFLGMGAVSGTVYINRLLRRAGLGSRDVGGEFSVTPLKDSEHIKRIQIY